MSESPQATSTQATSTQFAARPYRADGGFDARGVIQLVSVLVVVGGALGFAAHLVSQWFYLILIFPVLIGLGVGAAGAQVARMTHVRNPWLGGAAGLAAGVFAMAMMHYFDYRTFSGMQQAAIAEDPEFVEFVRKTPGEIPYEDDPADAKGVQPYVAAMEHDKKAAEFRQYVEAMRVQSFPAYMNYEAHQGVEIKSTRGGSNRTPLNLGYAGSWIYWVVETLIVAGIAYAVIRGQTAKPYCRTCAQWRAEGPVGFFAGDLDAAAAAVRDGDVGRLAQAGPTAEGGPGVLHVARCATPCADGTPEADVRLERVTYDKKGNAQRKTLAHATWPAAAADRLATLFAPAAPETATV